MKKGITRLATLFIATISVVVAANAINAEAKGNAYSYTNADYNVIPDRYNTGANEDELQMNYGAGNYSGAKIVITTNGDMVFNFVHTPNKQLGDVTVISGIDFSDVRFRVYGEGEVTEPKTIIFENCKFYRFMNGRVKSNVSFVFNNCTYNFYMFHIFIASHFKKPY